MARSVILNGAHVNNDRGGAADDLGVQVSRFDGVEAFGQGCQDSIQVGQASGVHFGGGAGDGFGRPVIGLSYSDGLPPRLWEIRAQVGDTIQVAHFLGEQQQF